MKFSSNPGQKPESNRFESERSKGNQGRYQRRFLALGLLLIFLICPPSFLFSPGSVNLSESEYWQKTALTSSVVDSYIDRDLCYKNIMSFFGCLNAIRQVRSVIQDQELDLKIKENSDGNWAIKFRTTRKVQFKSLDKLLASLKTQSENRISEWKNLYNATLKQKLPFNTIIKKIISIGKPEDESMLSAVAVNSFVSYAHSPHDHILPLQMVNDQAQNQTEEYKGIGVILRPIASHLVVIRTLPDSPARRSGLLSGDILTKIQDKPVFDMSLSEASEAITRIKDDKVRIQFFRNGQTLKTTVVKTEVELKNVTFYKHNSKKNTWGVIRIDTFQKEETCADVEDALYNLETENKVDGLILDMRDNPGGLVDQALCVADLFLPKNIRMLEVRSFLSAKDVKVYTSKFQKVSSLPMITLVNSGTASSAEIVSGILRENNRTLIIGQRTYGKGTILSGQPFRAAPGKDIVHYQTFAQFYFPSGRSYHAKGINPDIELPSMASRSSSFRESDLPYYHILGALQTIDEDSSPYSNFYLSSELTRCTHLAQNQEEPTESAMSALGCLTASKNQ
ncbi:MAG: PDZ domain-containing protein [Bdellovibrionales bacterium]|nr:PDZ domain-containing protein [Bdellovibrionales bacterium]